MKGDRGHLEGKPGDEEDQPDERPQMRPGGTEIDCRKGGKARRAGETVEERDTIEHHARGERAEDEVFEPGFTRARLVAVERRQHVEREALRLEADIEREQVVRRDHHQHAQRREQDEHRVLEARDPALAQIVARHGQHEGGAEQHQRLEKQGETVADEHPVKDRCRARHERDEREEGEQEKAHRESVHEGKTVLPAKTADEKERHRTDSENDLG